MSSWGWPHEVAVVESQKIVERPEGIRSNDQQYRVKSSMSVPEGNHASHRPIENMQKSWSALKLEHHQVPLSN